MQRINSPERHDWKETAENMGFKFHTFGEDRYWDERAYYQFTLNQIENDIEDPTVEIHEMCLDLVGEVVRSEQLMDRLCIPEFIRDQVQQSWNQRHPYQYGRMDFAYTGQGPAKLLELNYDTPTSLYEAGAFQYVWFTQMQERGLIPANADQFNSIHEKLAKFYFSTDVPTPLYFASMRGSEEDRGTVEYMRDIAHSVGLPTEFIYIEDIGWDRINKQFVDLDENNIPSIFKLCPYEHMFIDEFGKNIPESQTLFIEPTWKAILSNKGILPLLWERHNGHPNLLASYFDNNPTSKLNNGWVRKPFFSREGSNIQLATPNGILETVDGPYVDSPYILQEFATLPKFGDSYTLIGSWMIGNEAAGIGIREDDSLITKDSSRFLPHIFV